MISLWTTGDLSGEELGERLGRLGLTGTEHTARALVEDPTLGDTVLEKLREIRAQVTALLGDSQQVIRSLPKEGR